MKKCIHQKEFDEIINALQNHSGAHTASRIAYFVNPDPYEKGNKGAWDFHKTKIRATLKIMRLRGMLQYERSGAFGVGYTYWI